mmetsp:Transcript_37969/g.56459  ORF Transcript_37969/g.56459 Transcript_37969/m.56459 type:complete len:89 (-) Transcript_37969:62-328(-)|eukprot:CAMPEP_0194046274 /NCGR_PEP_ID=MMETSP0009_2-20130614/20146_1 /TAXON_ID=210454 /ORGANISM="Grammatophora oceanica, Strain CCMP 410" /LENGTH=88 /DNA_ID=CAMNT_0038691483 /DNA_START=42 /DNA_END=308 /DNA_ORIENTATION=+
MSGIAEKLVDPSWYSGQASRLHTGMIKYYQPLFKAGSAKPLFHFMIFTSFVMYNCTYWGHKQHIITYKHKEQKEALKEYRAKHGGDHH